MSQPANCHLVAGPSAQCMRCTSCDALLPVDQVVALEPGVCPAQARADAIAFANAGAYNDLFDYCVQRGWRLELGRGAPRPDLPARSRIGPVCDVVIELHGMMDDHVFVVPVPHEDDIEHYAASVLRSLVELEAA